MLETLTGLAGGELVSLIHKAVQKGRLNKSIYDIFHSVFTQLDNQDPRIGVLCDKNERFCQELFALAKGNIIDVGTLLNEAELHAQKASDPSFAPAAICESLEDFSRNLNNLYRAKISQELGHMSAGYVFFYSDVTRHCARHVSPRPVELVPRSLLFYVPHRPNPLLRHYRPWLERISEALASGQVVINQLDHYRDVALHGQGGLGKTAMAVAYAYLYQDRYPGGVFWIQSDMGLAQALTELARGLNWKLAEGMTDQQITEAVLNRLRTPELKLIILDNQEERVAPREITGLPASQLLVTTRLSEVSAGLPLSMGLPTEEEALGIFLAYAQLEDQELSDRQKEATYAICRRAGFLPLALEIMGKNARTTPLPDLAEALDQTAKKKSTVLTKGQELTIATALAVTSQKLSHPRAKEALLYLSYLYPEELNKNILSIVMGEEVDRTQNMLDSLAKFSLVQLKTSDSYSMHRLMQETIRLEDEGKIVGGRVVVVLDSVVRAISEKKSYKLSKFLSPHLTHLAELYIPESGEDDFPSYRVITEWAKFLEFGGLHQAADDIYEKIRRRIAEVKGEGHPDYSCILTDLALQKMARGMFTEAEKLFNQALEIDKRGIGTKHPDYARKLNGLAGTLWHQGKYSNAEELIRRALEIDAICLGINHPTYAEHLGTLAVILLAQEKFSESERINLQAMKIEKSSEGTDYLNYANRLNNMALSLAEQEKYLDAESLLRQALEIDKKTIGTLHPNYAIRIGNLARILEAQKKFKEAEQLRRLALDIHRKTLDENHPHIAIGLNNLAVVLWKQGRRDEAIEPLTLAVEIDQKVLGPEHPQTKGHKGNLKKLRKEMKRRFKFFSNKR